MQESTVENGCIPTDRGQWFQTFSGVQFHPLYPMVEDILIEDIAHALARVCRFGGHVKSYYSVAQHSVLVSKIVPEELAMMGLLHDASEAFIGDAVRPLKYAMPQYLEIESNLSLVIARRFNLPDEMPPEIKVADNILLMTERRDLLVDHGLEWGEWTKDFPPLPERITPLLPEQAESLFTLRFEELVNKQ